MGGEIQSLGVQALGWITSYAVPVGVLVSVLALLAQQGANAKSQRQQFLIFKDQVYARLQSLGVELLSFEANFAAELEKFRDEEVDETAFSSSFPELARVYGSLEKFIHNHLPAIEDGLEEVDVAAKPDFVRLTRELRVARRFYETTLNFFETLARYQGERAISSEHLGGYVLWMYDIHCEWAFRHQWPEMRVTFAPTVRAIFNSMVIGFDVTEDNVHRRDRFYAHCARIFGEPKLREWFADIQREDWASRQRLPGRERINYGPLRRRPL